MFKKSLANRSPMFAPEWSAGDDALYFLALPRGQPLADPDVYVVGIDGQDGPQITSDKSAFDVPSLLYPSAL